MLSSNKDMSKVELRVMLGVVFCLMFACSEPYHGLSERARGKGAPRYRILIVGEGIPVTRDSVDQIYPLNRSEASAMEQGASFSYSNSPSLEHVRSLVELIREDDRGTEAEAREIATRYQFDPLLLAVIGHSSSGASRVALERYEEAGIPVLLPIATSPRVNSRTGFRLPLNDKEGQAPALADFVVHELHARKVHIVRDVGEDAIHYTEPLTEFFRELLPSKKFAWADEVDAKQTDFAQEARNIMANHADVVVFVGYASTAVLFLDALRSAYAGTVERPILLLTDGSISEDLNPEGFQVFISAPMPEVGEGNCKSDEYPIFSKKFSQNIPNYEPFGYDAMLVLGDALKGCQEKGAISRACLVEQLRQGKFEGICNDYYFVDGENQEGQYTVFALEKTASGLAFSLRKKYTVDQLGKVAEGLRGRG